MWKFMFIYQRCIPTYLQLVREVCRQAVAEPESHGCIEDQVHGLGPRGYKQLRIALHLLVVDLKQNLVIFCRKLQL